MKKNQKSTRNMLWESNKINVINGFYSNINGFLTIKIVEQILTFFWNSNALANPHQWCGHVKCLPKIEFFASLLISNSMQKTESL